MSPCRLGPPRIALGAIVASVLSRFCVLVSCNQFTAGLCPDAHPLTPAERRGGRTALMTMPFGYVGIEHVSIRFTAAHARVPLGSWSTWSPRLVITC
jgi:hypothetical protein